MKVVILCGGKGTRIRDVSEDIPKPMVPVGHLPILWHVMQLYASQGYKDFILCLGYKAQVIKEFFLNYRALTSNFAMDFARGGEPEYLEDTPPIDWRITFMDTGLETLTGSRVSRIRHLIGDDERFMLTYGDGVADVDVRTLEAFHRDHGRLMTVTGVRPPGRFGELETDAAGAIREFNEKPQTSGRRMSGGDFARETAIVDDLDPAREDEILEAAPMRRIAREGKMIMYPHDGFWHCMDTRRDYLLLNELFDNGKAPWVAPA